MARTDAVYDHIRAAEIEQWEATPRDLELHPAWWHQSGIRDLCVSGGGTVTVLPPGLRRLVLHGVQLATSLESQSRLETLVLIDVVATGVTAPASLRSLCVSDVVLAASPSLAQRTYEYLTLHVTDFSPAIPLLKATRLAIVYPLNGQWRSSCAVETKHLLLDAYPAQAPPKGLRSLETLRMQNMNGRAMMCILRGVPTIATLELPHGMPPNDVYWMNQEPTIDCLRLPAGANGPSCTVGRVERAIADEW